MTPVVKLAVAAASLVLPLVAASTVLAQQQAPADPMSRMHMPAKPAEMGHGRTMKTDPTPRESPADTGYRAAAEHMHHAMTMDYTGDADADFVAMMIPHHEGAIAMARVVEQHGKDPEIRKLATAIIAAQEAEVAKMQEWLRTHKP